MQRGPDYTRQLTEIVRALNRPPTPIWVVALISSFFGSIFALLVQWFSKWMSEQESRGKMRRVLYVDITQLFFKVQAFLGMQEPLEPGMYQTVLCAAQSHIDFRWRAVFEGSSDVYVAEQDAARHLYNVFHKITNEPNHFAVNCHEAHWLVGFYLHQGGLQAKYFRKYSRHRGDHLVELAQNAYNQSIRAEQARPDMDRAPCSHAY